MIMDCHSIFGVRHAAARSARARGQIGPITQVEEVVVVKGETCGTRIHDMKGAR